MIASRSKLQRQGTRFVKLSATMSGVNDVKEVVKVASNEKRNFKRRTILFMDEIHRFNKLQQVILVGVSAVILIKEKLMITFILMQDIFLPHVENGTIILIGATTENPSFSLNSALLSRCKVFVLEKLQSESLFIILKRALNALGCSIVPGEDDSTHSSDDSFEQENCDKR